MNSETEVTMTAEDKTPSANWVRAVSDFLDTDPTDVLGNQVTTTGPTMPLTILK